ncbi:LuxR family transcriptional regulator (modular protein) [Mesorhizobium plurifarium]|uniref:LuxR family transcriptional regulator (Modular protein) n=1 Tax=Mesorhizobium plurifarium TaxID=69974 RepID=A0A090EA51_MESPL|nr:LuxR family transcriptional regulator (modular protein) [Mesorhizobium plurifarium]
MNNWRATTLFEILINLPDLADQQQVEAALARILDQYGLKTVAYLGAGLNPQRTLEPYLAVTYCDEWVSHYKAVGYVDIDPAVQIGMRRIVPVDWSSFDGTNPHVRKLFGEAAEFGLGRQGLSIPVHGRFGDRGLFSITSDLSPSDWAAARLHYIRDFQVLAVHLHDLALRHVGREAEPYTLSPRERECLLWAAEGKTAWECSVILGLSIHTVRCYLESARHKLHASGNTHAVAKAIKADVLGLPL